MFQALDLLDKLLTLDPSKRTDSTNALDHDFFWTDPMPGDLSKMLSQHTQVDNYSLFPQNTYLRNKKHTLTCQGGIGYYKAVNYQPGS